MISGYSGNGKINDALLVPNFYDKFCFTWSWFDGEQTANYDWDFSQYQPELIVVNLGTNDNSYTRVTLISVLSLKGLCKFPQGDKS